MTALQTVEFYDDGTAKATAKSVFSGKVHTLEVKLSVEQFDAWRAGAHIQNAMPHLSPAEREFFLSGATSEEWDEEFKETDDE